MGASFKGQRAIVTGAGSGIGRELALGLAREGAHVYITDINEQRLDAVVSELEEIGTTAGGYKVDHSSKEESQDFANRFIEEHGAPDIMCLNAGVGHGGRVEEMCIDDWEWLLSINVYGAVYMVQFMVPAMIERKTGRILITSSGLGLFASPGMSPYCTSKFAMFGLAESLRMELKAHNINVSVLCPGIINTNIVKDAKIYLCDSETGENVKGTVDDFYERFGATPEVVARDGIKALKKDKAVMPTPFHVWPLYFVHRLSPPLYQAIGRLVWRKGWFF